MRCLGILLCYNDGDLLTESIRYLRSQEHDVVLWDHGSTDNTPSVVADMRSELLEATSLPRSFDFYQLYPAMSKHLLDNFVDHYDWISWPDQDEFLEGPSRARPYCDCVHEVYQSGADWIEFKNFNYWFTRADDPTIQSTTNRVRHYSLFRDCPPRIRAWRATATNMRVFNHNPPLGKCWPIPFNLRHYPMRSRAQASMRVERDRAGLRRGQANFHYENMARWKERLEIPPDKLHWDDGQTDLNADCIFDWRTIYGFGSDKP